MSIQLRNEVKITLAGEERTMRATFEEMCEIEQRLGKSVVALMGRIANRDFGVFETATVIFHGLRGHGDTRLSFPEVGAAVMEAGIVPLASPVMEFIGVSMKGVKVGKSEEAPK